MTWLPQIPDLNPIEYLWKVTDNNVRAQKLITVIDVLQKQQEEWNKIMPEFCDKLVKNVDTEAIKINGLYMFPEYSLLIMCIYMHIYSFVIEFWMLYFCYKDFVL